MRHRAYPARTLNSSLQSGNESRCACDEGDLGEEHRLVSAMTDTQPTCPETAGLGAKLLKYVHAVW